MIQIVVSALLVAIWVAIIQIAFNGLLYKQQRQKKNWLYFSLIAVGATVLIGGIMLWLSHVADIPVLGGLIINLNLLFYMFWGYVRPLRLGLFVWFLLIPLIVFVIMTIKAGLRYRKTKSSYHKEVAKRQAKAEEEQAKVTKRKAESEQPAEPTDQTPVQDAPEPTSATSDELVDNQPAEPKTSAESQPRINMGASEQPSTPVQVGGLNLDLSAQKPAFTFDLQQFHMTPIKLQDMSAMLATKKQAMANGLLVNHVSATDTYELFYADGKGYKQAVALLKANHIDTTKLQGKPMFVQVTAQAVQTTTLKTLMEQGGLTRG